MHGCSDSLSSPLATRLFIALRCTYLKAEDGIGSLRKKMPLPLNLLQPMLDLWPNRIRMAVKVLTWHLQKWRMERKYRSRRDDKVRMRKDRMEWVLQRARRS